MRSSLERKKVEVEEEQRWRGRRGRDRAGGRQKGSGQDGGAVGGVAEWLGTFNG